MNYELDVNFDTTLKVLHLVMLGHKFWHSPSKCLIYWCWVAFVLAIPIASQIRFSIDDIALSTHKQSKHTVDVLAWWKNNLFKDYHKNVLFFDIVE